MTREFFNNRYAKLFAELKERANVGELLGLERIWGCISELCESAYELGTLSWEESMTHLIQASDFLL